MMTHTKDHPAVLVISPVRDEAAYLQCTIDSMCAQTVRPSLWLIVDDGSTDATLDIASKAAARYDWIRVCQRQNRGSRSVGGGVVDAFYHGLSQVDLTQYEYICKLDGDLDLPPRYIERILEHFAAEPALGTISGKVYLRGTDGRLTSERIADDMSVGAMKFYRIRCYQEIGGFHRANSWDGIDCHLCRLNKWIACSVDEPELRVIHLRQMGSSHKGIWTGRKRWGRGKYYMGSHPLYVLAVAAYRMAERPWIVGGLGIAVGYFSALITRKPKYSDCECRQYIRRYEMKCLFRGRRQVSTEIHNAIRKLKSSAVIS